MANIRSFAVSLLITLGAAGCAADTGGATPDEGAPVATARAGVRNGSLDTTHRYPDVVQLVMRSNLNTSWLCTATVVSPTRLLTAAHCLVGAFGISVSYDGGTVSGTNARIHPLFKIPTTLWRVDHPSIAGGSTGVTDGPDLGTVDVSSPLPITPRALGAPMQPGQSLTIVGYGETATGVPLSGRHIGAELGTTALPMIRGGMPRLPAGTLVVSAGAGSTIGCSGDSGSPVLDASGNIVAVTSAGPSDCNTSPNNSTTEVSPYASWILETGTPLPYHNYKLPVDVNDDGFVTTADTQMLLDTINTGGGLSSAPAGYRDVYPDGKLSSFDVIVVINATSQPDASGYTISPL